MMRTVKAYEKQLRAKDKNGVVARRHSFSHQKTEKLFPYETTKKAWDDLG
jgi:hypothetical protein